MDLYFRCLQPVLREDAPRYGLLKRAADCRIIDCVEKPSDPQVQTQFISRDDEARPFLGSMGIYLFNTEVLIHLLTSTVRAEVYDSVIGLRSQVARGVWIKDSILMGADYYDPPSLNSETIPLGLGEGCQISAAILDKNVRLGSGVVIHPFPRGTEIEHVQWVVRDGIVVIPKNTELPAGTVISPDN